MDLEEAESEEWNSNSNNNNVKRSVFTLGKKILVAGIIASSVPIVLPPLVVASAIGIAVSMPYAFFYATHACTHNLMSKLLPTPTYNNTIHDDIHIPQKQHQGNNDIQQQFETPFEVTNVVFEEFDDQEIHGEELQRETKGRDYNGGGEEYKVDNVNNSQNSMAETEVASQSQVLDEPDGDFLIEILQECCVSQAEDSSEVTTEKIDIHMIVEQELEPLIDGSTILQEGKLDDNASDFVNQESKLHEYNEVMDLSDADARGISDEIDPEMYTYSIDLHEESSNVMVDGHTGPTEVFVSTTENKFKASECSSGEDIMCSSHQVVLDEENIWKQIHIIRKIIGYEGATQATCMDELKALYIFTGVEPPTILKENFYDPVEINEKLHFLMSIVGIKSNVP
ncbi:hypothetical protein Lal_00000444 [Lupinus albus]|uniref:Uncharacterized protein n=1 Tax=Lupinus albus TaxID=3870 RepID=A0A6A5LLJ9_LUPAL|nr:hypothetical protein Lalb_Chr21g0311381 [Lupinus albus]KAF1861028.1 hypothetical protein Lal_00000444 [Lupinus albus]